MNSTLSQAKLALDRALVTHETIRAAHPDLVKALIHAESALLLAEQRLGSRNRTERLLRLEEYGTACQVYSNAHSAYMKVLGASTLAVHKAKQTLVILKKL
jgi:hypothetical protein